MVYFWRRRSGQTFRLTSDRLRENMALWGKNSTISPCLVDRYENKTIWGETRIQSSQKTWRKTQRTKRLFTPARKSPSEISHPVCSAYRSVFQPFSKRFNGSRSSGQRRRHPTHVYFICAFFTKRHPAGNGRRNRIRNIGHRIGVADVLLCSSWRSISGLRVPPSAVRSLGNSPLTASSRQHCSVCSARERERWICTRANRGISSPTQPTTSPA